MVIIFPVEGVWPPQGWSLGPDVGPLCGFSLVLAPPLPGGHRDLSVLRKVRLGGGRRRAEGVEQLMVHVGLEL